MPRWGDYMMSHPNTAGVETSQRRPRGDAHHFSLLQGGQRSSYLGQRGFRSPRNMMTIPSSSSEYDGYDAMDDYYDSSCPTLPGGYLPPGRYMESSSVFNSSTTNQGGRRLTPRPTNGSNTRSSTSGFVSRLGHRHQQYPSNPHYLHHHVSMGPIFPEEDDDTFFPPETLPPIDEAFSDYVGGSDEYSATSGYPELTDNRSREKFEERLASYPELPLEAHRRIFYMGNEIVDCFEVRLDRFFRAILLDSVPRCIAVFTKKERTGQRWLMVFKEDVIRTVVKFNRLLTHSLLVSVVSSTAIEVEAAKSLYGPPAEMCVLNFSNVEDASRFYKTLQEGQTTAWNHREVTNEQRMKTIYANLNVALARTDFINGASIGIASGSSGGGGGNGRILQGGEVPPSRSLFTCSIRNRGGNGILTHSLSSPSLSNKTNHQQQQSGGLSIRSRSRIADMDDDWRNRSRGGGGGGDGRDFFISTATAAAAAEGTLPQFVNPRPRPRSVTSLQQRGDRLLKKSCSPIGLGRIHGVQRMDGSGDGHGNTNTSANATMSSSSLGPIESEKQPGGLNLKQEDSNNNATDNGEDKIPGDIIFEVFVTVFVKMDPGDFAEFGTGTLQLLDHRDVALNELRLLDRDNREILQQYIYKWNSVLKRADNNADVAKQNEQPICVWDGAVCFSLEREAVPERRDFKVRLSSEEQADDFIKAFTKSVEKANDESIRKRHICWYLQNKRDYKSTPSTENNNNNEDTTTCTQASAQF